MISAHQPKNPALRSLYWREEIIEVALWLRGEGFDERLDSAMLATFLDIDRAQAGAHLDRLTAQGYLCQLPGARYGLTAMGEQEGQRLTGGPRAVPTAVPGACGPECWCPTSPVEASQCADSA